MCIRDSAAHRAGRGRRWALETFEHTWFDGHSSKNRKKYWKHDVPGVIAKIADDPVAPPPLAAFDGERPTKRRKAKKSKKSPRIEHDEYTPSGSLGHTFSPGRPREVAQDLLDHRALPPLAYRDEQWYAYRDGHYSPVTAETIFDLIAAALDGATYQAGPNVEEWKPAPAKVQAVMRMLQGLCVTDVEPRGGWLDGSDRPANLVPCRDGLLNPRTREVRPRSHRFLSTRYLDAEMRAEPGKRKHWDRFMRSLWQDDDDSIALLQEWLGYVISGDTYRQKGMLIVGPPRGGKGTILRVAEALVGGKYGSTSTSVTRIASNFGLMNLPGKSLLTVGDMRGSGRDATHCANLLLEMIGGDPISIDRKNKTPIDEKVTARVMVATNIVPTLYDDAAAIETRFLILRVTRSFLGAEDFQLEDRLLSELGAIAHWAMDGYARLQKRGRFTAPAADENDRRTLRHNANPALEFVDAACERIVGPGSTPGEVWRAYERWIRDEYGIGAQGPLRMSQLRRSLEGAGFEVQRPRGGDEGPRPRVYYGLRVQTKYSDETHAQNVYGKEAIVTHIDEARRPAT